LDSPSSSALAETGREILLVAPWAVWNRRKMPDRMVITPAKPVFAKVENVSA
jgi:hypothetical protein